MQMLICYTWLAILTPLPCRVYALTRLKSFALAITVLSLIIFGIALSLTVMLPTSPYTQSRTLHTIGNCGITLHLVNDIAISSAMIWYLRRNRTGIPRSDALIDDIVRCE